MSLYSFLNKDEVTITKLQDFVQTSKFKSLMQHLMKSEAITNNYRLRFTSPNSATEILLDDSKIIIYVDPRDELDQSIVTGYPNKRMPIATIELDSEAGTYKLINVDNQFHDVIDRTIDDLNYLFYQGE